ncbi:MAG: MmcQ/YjbR family DNA-binding protein [Pseudomonadota bacterium]
MTRDEFNAFCAALPGTSHVVQWGGSDVWKVSGKVFAVCGWADRTAETPRPAFTFKVTEMAFEILPQLPGLRPAPYMASRGLKWIQDHAGGLSDEELKRHLHASYDLVVEGLPKRAKAALSGEASPLRKLTRE